MLAPLRSAAAAAAAAETTSISAACAARLLSSHLNPMGGGRGRGRGRGPSSHPKERVKLWVAVDKSPKEEKNADSLPVDRRDSLSTAEKLLVVGSIDIPLSEDNSFHDLNREASPLVASSGKHNETEHSVNRFSSSINKKDGDSQYFNPVGTYQRRNRGRSLGRDEPEHSINHQVHEFSSSMNKKDEASRYSNPVTTYQRRNRGHSLGRDGFSCSNVVEKNPKSLIYRGGTCFSRDDVQDSYLSQDVRKIDSTRDFDLKSSHEARRVQPKEPWHSKNSQKPHLAPNFQKLIIKHLHHDGLVPVVCSSKNEKGTASLSPAPARLSNDDVHESQTFENIGLHNSTTDLNVKTSPVEEKRVMLKEDGYSKNYQNFHSLPRTEQVKKYKSHVDRVPVDNSFKNERNSASFIPHDCITPPQRHPEEPEQPLINDGLRHSSIRTQPMYPEKLSNGRMCSYEHHDSHNFNICRNVSKVPFKLNASLLEINKAKRMEHTHSQDYEYLGPGMVLLKKFIPHDVQVKIVRKCRDLGGFYRPGYSENRKFRLFMTCLGLNWDPETRKYEKIRQCDNAKPPCIPDEFKQLVDDAMKTCGDFLRQENGDINPEDEIPNMSPDICIVNFYGNNGKLGLHQDKDEKPSTLDRGLPVVSFSLGDSADFLYGKERDVDKAEKVVLESGDVLIFGGESRLIFHGVSTIHHKTAPPRLIQETELLRPGRLNLTFRQYDLK